MRKTIQRMRPGTVRVTFFAPWSGILSLLLLGTSVGWSAPGVTAQLDRNVVPVGETVTLSLIFDSIKPTGNLALPPMPNLNVVGGVGQSSQMTISNGQRSETLTLTYTLMATAPGDVILPPFPIPANGKMYSSQQLQLRIVPANAAAANAASTNLAFLRLLVPKTEAYIGEPFPVELQLYVQAGEGLQMPQVSAEGFSLSPIPQPAQSRTVVNGIQYNLLVFKFSATPARTGTLAFGPVQENLTLHIPTTDRRRSRDPFESFFFGGPQFQRRPVTLTSEAVSMRVLPLPAQNVPEGFNGAIGNYRLSASAGPTNLGVGDPITVRVQIAGRGPIDSLALPPQPQWRDFTTYPATAKVQTSDDLGLAGTKNFEQVVIPQNHEIKMLPPVTFSFFDPTARTYRTLTGPSIPLTVRPTGVAATPLPSLTNAASAAPPPVDDILHIKPRLELSASVAPLLVFRPWFLLLQGLPPLVWLSLLAWRKRTESLARNPRLRRQREVAQRVREGLKELHTHAGAQKPPEFFATLFRLLQEQLGERLDLPASAITEAVIDERLRGRELSDETLQSLRALFQTCNLARYAPVQTSQELAALIPRLEGALRDLQQLKA